MPFTMTSTTTQTRPNPLSVSVDTKFTKRSEAIVSATAATFGVTIKQLVDLQPGTSTLWDEVQFHRFDVYGIFSRGTSGAVIALPVAATLLNPAPSVSGDVPTFYSDGVGSSRRSHVAIVPSGLFRNTWFPGAMTSNILTITTDLYNGTDYEVLLQYTATFRSTPGRVSSLDSVSSVVKPAGLFKLLPESECSDCVDCPPRCPTCGSAPCECEPDPRE